MVHRCLVSGFILCFYVLYALLWIERECVRGRKLFTMFLASARTRCFSRPRARLKEEEEAVQTRCVGRQRRTCL